MAPVQNAPSGLAMPLPTMSKAEPWIGSNIEGVSPAGLMLAVAPLPRLPVSAEARSERMSACRLVATTVSIASGFVTMRAAMARSEEHTSELQSLMRISYAVFCLKKKKYISNHIKKAYY